MSASDLTALSHYEMPSSEGIHQMATALGEDDTKIKAITADFLSSVREQIQDVSSTYWQSCMSNGKWQTPENAYCSNPQWSGCVPASGATSCSSAANSGT